MKTENEEETSRTFERTHTHSHTLTQTPVYGSLRVCMLMNWATILGRAAAASAAAKRALQLK